ncbi:MAG: cytochrome d ubiquinol oxidase subunit II [Solirubrobacterales bacterium]|nr:cytochrome d ubiquinol oxidase subunit II [Solirubrobacterales bacterium]
MTLEIIWFCLVCFFWMGYLVLEGFDFGVGILLPVLARNEEDRRSMFATIGPVWDANEVWLIVAGGVTFGAFPLWYSTMFSGFYLALVLVLILLIVRVLTFEWRSKVTSPRWRSLWTWTNTVGSIGAPLVWGIALSNLLQGVPINADHTYGGNFGDLFSPYTVLGGITFVLLFAFHGSVFLTLRTDGPLRERSRHVSGLIGPVTIVVAAGYLAWTVGVAAEHNQRGVFPGVLLAALAAVALIAAFGAIRARREGIAFIATTSAIGLTVVTLFTSLYPRVMVSAPSFENSLTIANSASASYTLTVITIVAAVIMPVVLLYQGWTYHVFRARITGTPPVRNPVDLLARKTKPAAADGDS